MPVVTHPIPTAIPAAGAGKVVPVDQVLKPGVVVDAKVLAAHANLVKIAVSGLLLDVMSEVQLQPGTVLKLAVSQTADGLRLAVVDRQLPAQAAADGSTATTTTRVVAPPLQPDQPQLRGAAGPGAALQAAVAQAVRIAAPMQAGLSSLFANLPVIVASPAVPGDVKAAAAQLLAARPGLTENLGAAQLREAFRASGTLLEATIARGAAPAPDMKAALIVLRQLVAGWSAAEGRPLPPTGNAPPNPAATADDAPAGVLAVADRSGASARKLAAGVNGTGVPDPLASARAVKAQQGATLADLAGAPASDDEGTIPKPATSAAAPSSGRSSAEPAPPFRGAAPSAQPVAAPSIDTDTPAPRMAAQLLDQTDAALARQTLLQVASLPERLDAAGTGQPQQRWAFEIPFATPQGTAVAQFEIADEGGGLSETGAPKRVWRARFTLDIEPTGPVHALVSLSGGTTTVRMWAERADTAAQLRDSAQALDSALRQADLEPGDIVVQAGLPPQARLPRAGHFLDRAT